MPACDSAMHLMLTGGEATDKHRDTLGITIYIGTTHPGDSVAWHTPPDHTGAQPNRYTKN